MNYYLKHFGRIFQAFSLAESGNLSAAKSLLNGGGTADWTTEELYVTERSFFAKGLSGDFGNRRDGKKY